MPTVNEAERSADAETIAPVRELSNQLSQRKLRVYMMELWSFIPYYMAGLCSSLAMEDVEVKLGSVRYHLDRDYLEKAGLARDRLLLDAGGGIQPAAGRRLIKSGEYILNLMMLALRFSLHKPDILHVQYLPFLERGFKFELWFLAWARKLGIRVVYTVHNVTRQDAPEQGRPIFGRAYRLADALICHGEAARTELIRDFQIVEDKIWVIPHGPLFDDAPQLAPQDARSKLDLPLSEPLVLCLGVISEYKGIPFLLDAWKKLKAEGVVGTLVIAGTGDQRILTEIRERVSAEGLSDSVSLRLEFVPVEQVPLLYQAADVLVYPYKAGTTSGALLTGLNYGRAVVATRLPFFLEYLKDGQTALLVDYGKVDALASALQELIQQPQYRARLASALRREASQATGWREIARKTKQCYQSVIVP
jgi:glycosyltransferase involved in cell wall biosynthesis